MKGVQKNKREEGDKWLFGAYCIPGTSQVHLILELGSGD